MVLNIYFRFLLQVTSQDFVRLVGLTQLSGVHPIWREHSVEGIEQIEHINWDPEAFANLVLDARK